MVVLQTWTVTLRDHYRSESGTCISYIGYKSQEISATGSASINVLMQNDTQMIEEVVVTALGIKRSEKALSYNVQQVNTDAITSNKDANFVNSLSGKVAGVNINASSSGVGGVSKVVMRGTKPSCSLQCTLCY